MSFGTRNKMMCFFSSIIAFNPLYCCAFHQSLSSIYAETSRLRCFGMNSKGFSSGEDENSGIEVWLDLRGTSLTPKTALELWNLEESMNNIQPLSLGGNNRMDRVPTTPFHKCLAFSEGNSNGFLPQTENNGINRSIDVLIVSVSNDDDEMPQIFQQSDPWVTSQTTFKCVGRLLPLQSSSSSLNTPILPDPLPAMDVISKGQWVILDTEGWMKVAEEERLRLVLPMLELLSPGVSSSTAGGIGVTCQTNNEIVKAIMYIQCMTSGGGRDRRNVRTKTLDSGIVVPQQLETEIDSALPRGCRFAIVVPCDMGLLRTAKLMLANNNDLESVLSTS